MGFLTKKIAKTVAKRVGFSALENIDSHMRQTRSIEAVVQNSCANYNLLIRKKSMSPTRCFWVAREKNRLYSIKTEAMTFGLPCIRLYDLEENELGRIQTEKSQTTRTSMRRYGVYVKNDKVGTLNQALSLKKKIDFDLNGWSLEGNTMQNQFNIYDRDGQQIMKITDTHSTKDTYVLELDNRENEIMGLLMLMAVEISINGKF